MLWLSDATSFKKGRRSAAACCLLAMVWPVSAAGTAFSWFCHATSSGPWKAHNEDDNGAVPTLELQANDEIPCAVVRTSLPCTPASSWVNPRD